MKLPKYTVIVILIVFAVETQCGVIDNIFGVVKDTSDGLRQDVSNIWSFSKKIVGYQTPPDNNPEEEKRGLIGSMLHTTREKVHNIHSYFWNTDNNAKDAGIIGNMYNRIKNKLSKVYNVITLEETQTPRLPSDKEKLIQQTINKLFFSNGTRKVYGVAFHDVIDNLRGKLQDIKKKIKNEMETSVNHGEGLIDVRLAGLDVENNINDNTAGVNNDVYDTVVEKFNKTRDDSAKSYDKIKNDGAKVAVFLSDEINSAADKLNVIRDRASDAAEDKIMQDSFNYVGTGIQNFERNVENNIEDVKPIS